jgi:predicted kinase
MVERDSGTAGAAAIAARADDLGRAGAEWLLAEGPDDPADLSLYHGEAGRLLALHEAAVHLDDDRFRDAADGGAAALAARLDEVDGSSLYFGATGVAVALHALGREQAARRALGQVRARAVDGRWGPMFELLLGNAGVGLGALAVGDLDLAVTAVEPYAAAATPTAGGVSWAVRPSPPRSHHVAHGTLGIVLALAAVGRAADRRDLVDLALAGAADVVARDEQGPEGFLVPHSDPPHRPDVIERYSLGWCNGPAGDAQAFRLLAQVTGDDDWRRLADRCWHTVTTSGLPRRTRPGFWDNQGRCCGTAGVLALAVDRVVERGDDPSFAGVLVDDLATRATRDGRGARWSNHEHRATPPDLPPRTGWAMGGAGIVRELLRCARVLGRDGQGGRDPAYAVAWPDHPPARPRSPRMVLMCGVAGSGKSTYARGLEARGWARFSIDAEAYAAGLRDAADVPVTLAARVRARHRREIGRLLDAGRDVVVDYAFFSRAQRDDYRALGRRHGAAVEVVHLATDEAEVRRRLAARRGAGPDDFVVGADLLARYLAGFEAPGPGEDDVTVVRTAR